MKFWKVPRFKPHLTLVGRALDRREVTPTWEKSRGALGQGLEVILELGVERDPSSLARAAGE